MNQSWFLTKVKRQLGLINIVTPYEDLDSEILSIVKDYTIPTFSVYCMPVSIY